MGGGKTANDRAPADREVSINDSGFTKPGLGVAVMCLNPNPNRNRDWGLLGRDGPEREQRGFPALFILIEQYQELE